MKKEYVKPVIVDEDIEIEDICASSGFKNAIDRIKNFFSGEGGSLFGGVFDGLFPF